MSPTLPSSWDPVLVTAALDEGRPIIRPTVKTAARDYREQGAFPIVDQSQNAIAGWTDNVAAVLRPDRPVVVFGDHTRTFKYVDFPFATGADGTLVLNPSEAFDPLFFYFACLGLEIPARGYNRHYTMLKEMAVPKPPIAEQRKIAAVLGKVQAAVAVEGALVRVARELKQAALRQLFTRGLRGEPQKQTALGPVPESWEVVKLEDCCSVLSSSMAYTDLLSRDDITAPDAVNCMGVKVSDMNLDGNEISFTIANLRKKIAIPEAKRRTIPAEVIVFPKRGAAIATNKKRMTTTWTALDPNLIGVRAGNGLLPWFLFQWFQRFDLRTITEPGPTPQLNKKNLTPLFLPVPPEAEQREIAALLATLDAKIAQHEARQGLLRELFRTLLHDLLTARRRVTSLHLADLSIAP